MEPVPTYRMTREELQHWLARARRKLEAAHDEDLTTTDRISRIDLALPSKGIVLLDEEPNPETTAEFHSDCLLFEKLRR